MDFSQNGVHKSLLLLNLLLILFFFMSGFLVGYLMLLKLTKMDNPYNPIWFPFAIFHRFLRLTPTYMFIVLFWWKVLRLFDTGPFWGELQGQFTTCEELWWTNLLYINNLITNYGGAMCYGVSWYLANDTQFFILSPIFVLLFLWNNMVGFIIPVLGVIASVSYSWWLAGAKEISWFPNANQPYYYEHFYIRPWTRCPPYLIGLFCAFLWYRYGYLQNIEYEKKLKEYNNNFNQKQQLNGQVGYINSDKNQKEETENDTEPKPPRIPQKYVIILSIFAATMMLICVYSTTSGLNNIPLNSAQDIKSYRYPWPPWLDHMYFSMSRPIWTISLAIIVMICFFRQGGIVQSFLELKIFVPIGKISFPAYLIHPIILDWFYYSRTQPFYYTDINFAAIYVGVLFIVFAISFVIHLLIELPLVKVEKLITGDDKKKEDKSKEKSNDTSLSNSPFNEPTNEMNNKDQMSPSFLNDPKSTPINDSEKISAISFSSLLKQRHSTKYVRVNTGDELNDNHNYKQGNISADSSIFSFNNEVPQSNHDI